MKMKIDDVLGAVVAAYLTLRFADTDNGLYLFAAVFVGLITIIRVIRDLGDSNEG